MWETFYFLGQKLCDRRDRMDMFPRRPVIYVHVHVHIYCISHMQEIVTPVVELELKAATEEDGKAPVVPEGVLVELRHFLKVPTIPPCEDDTDNDGQVFHLIKITKVNGDYVKEIMDTKTEVTSEYFGSTSLVGKPLCSLLWIAIRQVSNMHLPPRHIIVTRHWQTCAHSASKLSVYAFCHCDDKFKNLISNAGQRKTDAVTEVFIGQRDELVIKVKGGEGEWIQLQETVTNLKLCKFNGGFRLGHFRPIFDCTCANEPCNRPGDLDLSFSIAMSQTSTILLPESQRSLGILSVVGIGSVIFTGCFLPPFFNLFLMCGATIALALAFMSQEESAVSEPPIDCSLDLGCDCSQIAGGPAQICEYDDLPDIGQNT